MTKAVGVCILHAVPVVDKVGNQSCLAAEDDKENRKGSGDQRGQSDFPEAGVSRIQQQQHIDQQKGSLGGVCGKDENAEQKIKADLLE